VTDLVVVGASAGGIEALSTIVTQLPADLDAAVLIVVHVPASYPSHLPEILARQAALPAAHVADGEPIRLSTIRVAPPDHHLVVRDGHLHLTRGPRENRHRPSIDVLFRTAAEWYGPQVTGVILSGGPGDGVAGARAISEAGGTLLVQAPNDATIAALPQSVLPIAEPDAVMPAFQIGRRLGERANGGANASLQPSIRKEVQTAGMTEVPTPQLPGWQPSGYACPDCSGALWERDDGHVLLFRCRVGHGFSSDGLLDAKGEELEGALWSAINVMEERAELAERLKRRAQEQGFARTAQRYQATVQEMRGHVNALRDALRPSANDRELEATTTEVG